MGGLGRASGKLILFGEHAAVHGCTAIGVSLPERTTVRIAGDSGKAWVLDQVPSNDREMLRGALATMEEMLPALAAKERARVEVESSVPRGLGFGSSAALCAALARAALAHAYGTGRSRDIDQAWGMAHAAERLFHGTPSGIDTGLSLMDGMLVFQPRPPALPSCERLRGPGVRLVVAAVPRDASCAALIAGLGGRLQSGDRAARSSIEALGSLAAKARTALETGASIGELADRAMDHLRGLGLSSRGLDLLLDAGRSAGALGGKLSGAGAGGAFFLVVKDDPSARLVGARLVEAARSEGIALVYPPRLLVVGD